MKKIILCVITAFALFGTQFSRASGWYTGPIDRIQLDVAGSVILFVSLASNHECGSKVVQISDTSTAAAKTMIAALLSYEAQKDSVQFFVNSCTGTTGNITKIESSVGV